MCKTTMCKNGWNTLTGLNALKAVYRDFSELPDQAPKP